MRRLAFLVAVFVVAAGCNAPGVTDTPDAGGTTPTAGTATPTTSVDTPTATTIGTPTPTETPP